MIIDNNTKAVTFVKHDAKVDGGYLFAHMTDKNYGKLFYSISRNGFEWQTLNSGNPVSQFYKGHPDIIRGHDGAFYMISVNPLEICRSEDLISWSRSRLNDNAFKDCSDLGYYIVNEYFGAPKLFWDDATGKYIITWHAGQTPNDAGLEDWDTITTLFITTSDFKHFSKPQKLFDFTGKWAEMRTIDTIIRKAGPCYYAIIKDERSPDISPETGKCILICKANSATGPWSNPVVQVTPNDIFREAPIFIELPKEQGYAIYAESYVSPPLGYQMFVADNIDGVWKACAFIAPDAADGTSRPGARHGCIIRVNEETYQKLVSKYHSK